MSEPPLPLLNMPTAVSKFNDPAGNGFVRWFEQIREGVAVNGVEILNRARSSVSARIAAGEIVAGSDERIPDTTADAAFRIRDLEGNIAFEVNAKAETVIGRTAARESSPHYPTTFRITDLEGNIPFEVDQYGQVHGVNESRTRTLLLEEQGSVALTKVGVVLDLGPAGTFDAAAVESPCIYLDPVTGLQTMLYSGYNRLDGTAECSIGKATSVDGVTWTRAGQFFTGSGTAGAPDQFGAGGANIVVENGTEHLFYIGLTAPGYEGGNKRMCHASRPIGGQWVRHGAVISPAGGGWYSQQVYHPNLIQYRGLWYMFFNATGSPGSKERIGFATSRSLSGPWAVDPVPLFADPAEPDYTRYKILSGDPFVWLENGQPRMDYFRAATTAPLTGFDLYATTSWEQFPRGWVERGVTVNVGAAGSFDAKYAHKPWITRQRGRIFHYYTAVTSGDRRTIALAISGGAL